LRTGLSTYILIFTQYIIYIWKAKKIYIYFLENGTFHIYINIYPIYNIYMESCSKDGLPQNDFGRLGEEDWGRKEGGRGAKK